MPFEFAEPTPTTRSGGPAVNSKIYEAIDFANSNKGRWFVYETVDEVPEDRHERTAARAAAASRAAYVKRTADKRGIAVDTATRIENDEKIVTYLRGLEDHEVA